MREKLMAIIEKDGNVTVAAYCLKTDSWDDYLAFKEDAQQAAAQANQRNANRFLRAALGCLFAHMEAVAIDIETECSIPVVYSGTRLWDKTRNITREAQKHGRVPKLNFRLGKHLRDLIAHPGIEKSYDGETLDSGAVFDRLDMDTLQGLESQIGSWLEAVCRLLKVQRFTDTESLVRELGNKLGTVRSVQEV